MRNGLPSLTISAPSPIDSIARTMRPANSGRVRERERDLDRPASRPALRSATPRHCADFDVDDSVEEVVVAHTVPIRRPVLLWHHVRPVLRALPARWVVL